MILILARARGAVSVKSAALLLAGAMFSLGCGHGQSSQCTDVGAASSKVSVSYAPDGGAASSFDGSAREGPNLTTKQFDPHEIQLFLSDVSECGGTSLPTREIVMNVYAYALPQGAIPGTYVIRNSVGSSPPPTFATFSATGLGDLQNDPSGSLILTRADGCVAKGSFQVSISMVGGGTIMLSGSFVAPFCAVK